MGDPVHVVEVSLHGVTFTLADAIVTTVKKERSLGGGNRAAAALLPNTPVYFDHPTPPRIIRLTQLA